MDLFVVMNIKDVELVHAGGISPAVSEIGDSSGNSHRDQFWEDICVWIGFWIRW